MKHKHSTDVPQTRHTCMCTTLYTPSATLEGIWKFGLKLFRNFRKSTLTFQSQSFQNLERVFGSSSQLCWELLNSFSYYRVFDSQNLSLKFGFRIHTFARIDTFWGPNFLSRIETCNSQVSILAPKSSNWNFQIPATAVGNRFQLR